MGLWRDFSGTPTALRGLWKPRVELVQCGECRAEHLAVIEVVKQGEDWLQPRHYDQDEDEFQQELEPVEEDEAEGEAPKAAASSRGLPRLLVRDCRRAGQSVGRPWPTGASNWREHAVREVVSALARATTRSICPCCHAQDRQGHLFRTVRLGPPFLLQTAVPIVLRHLPALCVQHCRGFPCGGRRLISFTDSPRGRRALRPNAARKKSVTLCGVFSLAVSAVRRVRPIVTRWRNVRSEILNWSTLPQNGSRLEGLLAKTLADEKGRACGLGSIPCPRSD